MLGLGIWRLSIPTDLVVKDSPEFIDALKIWHPVLIAKRNTPRSVKRFINRVRYFAMWQSAETEPQSVWQKLAVWVGIKQREETMQVERIPESILVALSAIHHFGPSLVELVSKWRYTTNGFQGFELDAVEQRIGLAESTLLATFQAIKEHSEKFNTWPPTKEDHERFEILSAGIRIN